MTRIALLARGAAGRAADESAARRPHDADTRDYLVRAEDGTWAGTHALVDAWGIGRLDCVARVRTLLRGAAESAGARVLHVHVHEFNAEGGVSGVAVLAESHISVHTWPEIDYAAFDVFMCGNCSIRDAVAHLEREIGARRFDVREFRRGPVT